MPPSFAQLFADFDGGRITRRQLLQALAVAAIAVPAAAFGQDPARGAATGAGGRGGRGRGRAPRDTVPLVMPFEPTGWNTVWLDHFNYQCVDHKKAAAFYCALMGWKVRAVDGHSATLDIGENVGGVVIRDGLAVPPPPAITDAGLGVTRPPIRAVYDGFAWGIDQWDEKRVRADLEKRGLKPVARNHGDYRSFWFKDPDGFDVAVTNGTRENRRKTPVDPKLQPKPPFEPTNWNTLYLDHISFEVPDYRRSAAFYQALLGWKGRPGGGGQTTVQIGEGGVAGGAIIRGNAAARAAQAAARGGRGDSSGTGAAAAPPPPRGRANGVTAAIGHISFGIENWDTDRVRAELIKRDVVYVNKQGQREPRPDMTGTLESFHVPDAMGWDLQIGNKIAPA
jgi:catechol 2,3-dioxygenase-like lactoylglutathione lyase family enzyme